MDGEARALQPSRKPVDDRIVESVGACAVISGRLAVRGTCRCSDLLCRGTGTSGRWLLAASLFLMALPADGQTRAAQLDQERADRVTALAAKPPTFIDRALVFAEKHKLPERVAPEAGVYPKVGSITTGGGLAFGAGYRRAFSNDDVFLDSTALFSIKGYREGRVEVAMPRLLKQAVEVSGHLRFSHFPQEEFFGLGADSRETDRTNFKMDESEYAARVAWRPRRWLQLAGQQAWRQPRVSAGTDSHHPSTQVRFDDRAAPGLNDRVDFLETGALAEISALDAPGSPHRGGRYVAYVARVENRNDRGYAFVRVASQVEQYVPVFDPKRVVAVRFITNHLRADGDARVPFYYMTPIGGRDSIRGFDDLRFRDTNTWLVNTEYRWEAIAGVDFALFYDRGSVAPRFSELSWRHARESYGFAVRLGTARSIAVRAEIAAGSHEGFNYYVAAGAPLRVERFLR